MSRVNPNISLDPVKTIFNVGVLSFLFLSSGEEEKEIDIEGSSTEEIDVGADEDIG